jgi:hypothetical protein
LLKYFCIKFLDVLKNFSPHVGSQSSSTVSPTISDLPIEILEKICGHLSLQSVLNLTLTCKRLNVEIFTSSAIMRKMKLRLASASIIENPLFVRHYQKMEIQFTFNIDYFSEEFSQYGKYIKELIFSCKTDSGFLLQVLQTCKKLESICLYDHCRKDYKTIHFGLYGNMPKLKSVCIHDSLWVNFNK